MTDLLFILFGVLMIAFAVMSFTRGRRAGLWKVPPSDERLKHVAVGFDGTSEVRVDLDEVELPYEVVVRAAWERGYVPAGRERTRINDIATFTHYGPDAPVPGVLPESPEHRSWLNTPEGRASATGSTGRSFAVLLGIAGALVIVLAVVV